VVLKPGDTQQEPCPLLAHFKLNPSSKITLKRSVEKLLLTPEEINLASHFLTLWKNSMVHGSWAKERANVLG